MTPPRTHRRHLSALLLALLASAACKGAGTSPEQLLVQGTVRAPDGAPLGGVRWWVERQEQRAASGAWRALEPAGLPFVTLTGADGTFALAVRARRRVDLAFHADEREARTVKAVEPGAPLVVVLEPR